MSDDLKVLCLLDVLGFKNLLTLIGLEKLSELYAMLTEYVKEQTGGLDILPMPDGHVAVGWLVIGNAYFSDTLLFWTKYNKVSLPSFTQLVAETICYGIEHKLPLRGALSVGEAILHSQSGTYLGQPIVEAEETYKLQKWIGVSLCPSFSKPNFNQGFYLNTVLPYKSHYKDPSGPYATGMVVDWPRRWRETRKTDIRSFVSAMDTNPDFSEYYTGTLKFINFSERNHDWFKKKSHLEYG